MVYQEGLIFHSIRWWWRHIRQRIPLPMACWEAFNIGQTAQSPSRWPEINQYLLYQGNTSCCLWYSSSFGLSCHPPLQQQNGWVPEGRLCRKMATEEWNCKGREVPRDTPFFPHPSNGGSKGYDIPLPEASPGGCIKCPLSLPLHSSRPNIKPLLHCSGGGHCPRYPFSPWSMPNRKPWPSWSLDSSLGTSLSRQIAK